MNRQSNKPSKPTQIYSFLYQGKAPKVSSYEALVEGLGIRSIINCTTDFENIFEERGIAYLRVPVEDKPGYDISEYFERTNQFISR